MNKKKIKLLELIWRKGMNQTVVAQKTGISESRISRILNSHTQPKVDEIETLSNLLSMKVQELNMILKEENK